MAADRLKMVTTRIASAMTDKSVTTLITAGDALVRQYVSDPLAAQTINTNVRIYARAVEALATVDAVSRIVLKVVSNDGSTVRGTLLAFGDFSTGAEWNTSLRNKSFADGDMPSSVAAQAGDRLVLEIGFNHGAVISSAAINFGDDSATDLVQDETTTTANNPWLDIGQVLEFSSTTPITGVGFGYSFGYGSLKGAGALSGRDAGNAVGRGALTASGAITGRVFGESVGRGSLAGAGVLSGRDSGVSFAFANLLASGVLSARCFGYAYAYGIVTSPVAGTMAGRVFCYSFGYGNMFGTTAPVKFFSPLDLEECLGNEKDLSAYGGETPVGIPAWYGSGG